MQRMQRLPPNPHPAMKQLVAALVKPADGCEVAMANALFGQKQFGWKPDFLADLSANYGAGLREVDFVGDTEAVTDGEGLAPGWPTQLSHARKTARALNAPPF